MIAFDLAKKEDRTIITYFPKICFKVGDTLYIWNSPNSHKTKVIQIISDYSIEVKTFIRPSHGYAKHIRKLKRK